MTAAHDYAYCHSWPKAWLIRRDDESKKAAIDLSSSMHSACCAAVGTPQKIGCLKAVQEKNAAGHQPASGTLEKPQAAPTLSSAPGILHPASGTLVGLLSWKGRAVRKVVCRRFIVFPITQVASVRNHALKSSSLQPTWLTESR